MSDDIASTNTAQESRISPEEFRRYAEIASRVLYRMSLEELDNRITLSDKELVSLAFFGMLSEETNNSRKSASEQPAD